MNVTVGVADKDAPERRGQATSIDPSSVAGQPGGPDAGRTRTRGPSLIIALAGLPT
ncbi:hypothetical protein [Micromonospora avicenniae]|uniref:hypothetical protein n=1 Tax=Micromonospora avicenniae TaxID=1198245 RepID=UPI00331EDE3F